MKIPYINLIKQYSNEKKQLLSVINNVLRSEIMSVEMKLKNLKKIYKNF